MDKLKKYNLGFFLTEINSLQNWENNNSLSREIAPYNLLAKKFNKIYLFTYGDKKELKFQKHLADNIEIVYKKIRMPLKYYNWLLPILNWKKIRKCHIIKTNQFKSKAVVITKFLRPKVKFILRGGYLVSLFEKKTFGKAKRSTLFWEKLSCKKADKIFLTSEGDRKHLIERYNIKEEKILVIGNNVDTDLFIPSKVEKYTDRIFFIGRIDPQKNIPILIESLSGTDIKLDFFGGQPLKGDRGESLEKIKNIAKKFNIEMNVFGKIPNEKLPEELNKYKVFVLPSLYEGMPKVLLEAMSCELTCVATNVEGNKELIEDNVTGILADVTPESLKEKILLAFKSSDELGKNARKFILNNFSLEKQHLIEVEQYEKLIQ